nr:uncharacterized mitochondrial protein AtMg00810-like [Tanacetum cinerariifolium]
MLHLQLLLNYRIGFTFLQSVGTNFTGIGKLFWQWELYNADHAGCIDSRKSTSGGIQFLGDKLVTWMSKKQNCTAMSSAEAEYMALSASCAKVMWMRTQLQDYGFNYNKILLKTKIRIFQVQTSGSGISSLLAVWKLILPVGTLNLAVGMPCAFYSQHKSHLKSNGKSAQAEEPIHIVNDLEEPIPQEFNIGFTKDQPIEEASQHPNCNLARKDDSRDLFNNLMDTPLDFLAFVMNQLKVDTLTPELLASPTFELVKGSCKSLLELKYFLEEFYKETTDQLDWNNPKGRQYPHDLRKPLPLIPNSQGCRIIPFDHFINNDLAYLRGGASSRTYENSMTKTKAADYGHIRWIEGLVPSTIYAINKESAYDVYSRHSIIAVIKLQIFEWHNYKHLDWTTVRRNDDKIYTFKEGDYKRLRLQDIKDMLLLLTQGKLTNLTIEERLALNVSL